jgi:hypothetical protein
VTVSNTLLEGTSPETKTYDFFTGVAPTISQFSVTPAEGLMYDTEFTLILADYAAPKDSFLTYNLFGVVNKDDG